MSLSFTIYNFSKPKNSFSVPDFSTNGVWKTSVTLIEPCTISNPVVKLARLIDGLPINGVGEPYNYAYIEEFGRYYFIDSWTALSGGLWQAELSVDPLASFRSSILSTTQYLLRSESGSRFTPYITDTLYPTLNQCIVERNSYNLLKSNWTGCTDHKKGCYVLSIISTATDQSFGSSTLYCFTHDEMVDFCDYLYGSTDWLNINLEEISSSLSRMLFDPIHYITSAVYYPFDAGWFSGQATKVVRLGWWTLNKPARVLTMRTLSTGSVRLDIPKHPQEGFGTYMNCEPYTQYTFRFPGVGYFPIDGRFIAESDSLLFGWDIDIISGEVCVNVHSGDGETLVATGYGQVGVSVQLSQIRANDISVYAGAAQAVGGKLFNALPASDIGGKISNVVNGIASAIETANSDTGSVGSSGSFLKLLYDPEIKAVFRLRTDEDVARFGKPCCSEFCLEPLTGYIQTLQARFSNLAKALPGEVDQICQLLDGGAYIE